MVIHLDKREGAYRCSPVPIFPSPFVHQSLCFPVPMFPDPIFPSSYVPQSLSSPTRYALCFPVSVFPSPFASQSLCSSKMFPNPYVPQFLCSPVPMFPWSAPSPYVPQRYSPVPMLPSPYRLCSRTIFPRTVSSPNFPQRCSPVPILHISVSIPYAPQIYSPVQMFSCPDVPLKCFQSLCSPKIFPSPYVPQSPWSHAPQSL